MFGMHVKIACIFDRDYRCDREVSEFIDQMNSEAIVCHVLGRKEIENYALERQALIRTARKRILERQSTIDDDEIEHLIDDILNRLLPDVRAQRVSKYLSYIQTKDSWREPSTVIHEAMADFELAWEKPNRRFDLVSGKEFLSVFSAELQSRYRASITLTQVINEMRREEISAELVTKIADISAFLST
jgi:hypothetical protein